MYKVKDRNLILYCSTLLNVGITPIIVPLIFLYGFNPKQKAKALSFRKTQRFLFLYIVGDGDLDVPKKSCLYANKVTVAIPIHFVYNKFV